MYNWKEESAKTMEEFLAFLGQIEEKGKLPALLNYRLTCVKRRIALMKRTFSQDAECPYKAKKLLSTISDLEIALNNVEPDLEKDPLLKQIGDFIVAFGHVRLFEEEEICYF